MLFSWGGELLNERDVDDDEEDDEENVEKETEALSTRFRISRASSMTSSSSAKASSVTAFSDVIEYTTSTFPWFSIRRSRRIEGGVWVVVGKFDDVSMRASEGGVIRVLDVIADNAFTRPAP